MYIRQLDTAIVLVIVSDEWCPFGLGMFETGALIPDIASVLEYSGFCTTVVSMLPLFCVVRTSMLLR